MRLLVLPHAKVVGWPLTPESLRKRLTAEHHQCPELGDALAAEYATDAHHNILAVGGEFRQAVRGERRSE